MATNRLLVAIDIGTTGARCMIFDEAGQRIASGYQEYGVIHLRNGWVEQSLPEILGAMEKACRSATRSPEVKPALIASIGLSTQQCVTCPADSKGEPIRQMFSWQDVRASHEAEMIERRVTTERFKAITGMPITPQWTLAKILWLRENEPDVYADAQTWLQIHQLALLRLGAEGLYVDEHECAMYGMWNVSELTWDPTLLDLAGATPSCFGKVVQGGTQVGTVNQTAAAATGLPAGTPLCVGSGDAGCSMVGMGTVKQGDVSITIGTAGAVLITSDIPRLDLAEFLIQNHVVPGRWSAGGVTLAAGSAYRWFRDVFGQVEMADAQRGDGKDVFELLNELCATAPAGCNGLIFLPYLSSAGSPHWNSEAKGAFLGIAQDHERSHFARAVMEGVALEIQDILTRAQDYGLEVENIKVGGGASRSPLWTQIQANIYGRPVQLLKEGETSALGAAILGGVGARLFSSIEEGIDTMVDVTQTIDPEPSQVPMYQALYGAYASAYGALAPSVFAQLNGLVGE
jgi:xylulokinase